MGSLTDGRLLQRRDLGCTFGGAATLLQTAFADTDSEGADVALSMNVV